MNKIKFAIVGAGNQCQFINSWKLLSSGQEIWEHNWPFAMGNMRVWTGRY
jgi:hypothetical protein